MARNAALFDDISDKLATAGLKVQGFFVGVADQVAPVLQPLLDWFASQDLAAQGQAFGKSVATVIQMLVDGTVWNALQDGLALAAIGFVNTITSGINSVVALLANIPGMGGLGGLQIGQIDTSGIQSNLDNSIATAMGRVDAARAAADAKAGEKKSGAPGDYSELGAKGGAAGGGPSVSRMFSTSMGIFVKDPLLAESRRTNTLLERIERGISGLRPATPGAAMPGTQLRFT